MAETSQVRHRSLIPIFATGCTANPDLAAFDQFRLSLPNYRVTYSDDDALSAYLRLLGATPVFRSEGGPRRWILTIRRGWLFSGKLLFSRSHGSGNRTARLRLKLRLNPTRFLAHRPIDLGELIAADGATILRENEETAAEVRSQTLDAESNMMLLRDFHRARQFRDYAYAYFGKVLALIEDTLSEHADNRFPAVGGDRDVLFFTDRSGWVTNNVETYWEFTCEDAVSLVHDLRPHIHSISGDAETAQYPVPRPIRPLVPGRPRRRTRRNAISLTMDLGANGAELIVYAKAYDRVRFEIRYRRNLRQILGTVVSGRIEADFTGLRRMLDATVQSAHRRLVQVFRSLSDIDLQNPPSLTLFFMLVSRLMSAADGDWVQARRVLTLLANNGGITDTGNPAVSEIIARLEETGALVRVRATLRDRSARYAVAAGYRSTLRAVVDALRLPGGP